MIKNYLINFGDYIATEGKAHKGRHKTQRPTVHTLRDHINTLNWKSWHAHRGSDTDMCMPYACGVSLWFHMSFTHIDLNGHVYLVTFILTLAVFLPPLLRSSLSSVGRYLIKTFHLWLNILKFLILCTIPGCEYQYRFLSAGGWSYYEDDWARHWSMNIAKYY